MNKFNAQQKLLNDCRQLQIDMIWFLAAASIKRVIKTITHKWLSKFAAIRFCVNNIKMPFNYVLIICIEVRIQQMAVHYLIFIVDSQWIDLIEYHFVTNTQNTWPKLPHSPNHRLISSNSFHSILYIVPACVQWIWCDTIRYDVFNSQLLQCTDCHLYCRPRNHAIHNESLISERQ